MEKAKTLLKLLTEKFPPGEKQHHSISLHDDKLAIFIMQSERWRSVFLDENDMNNSAEQIVEDIVKFLNSNQSQ